jgi:D-methionine transport system permease protein
MGATTRQTVLWALLPETLAGILAAIIVTAVALVGYSAMAGVIGGGGLGDLAVRYGYQRFNTPVMLVTVAILVVLVQVIQVVGDRVVARFSHR